MAKMNLKHSLRDNYSFYLEFPNLGIDITFVYGVMDVNE